MEGNKVKVGDTVRVLYLWPGDRKSGLRVGDEVEVIHVLAGDSQIVVAAPEATEGRDYFHRVDGRAGWMLENGAGGSDPQFEPVTPQDADMNACQKVREAEAAWRLRLSDVDARKAALAAAEEEAESYFKAYEAACHELLNHLSEGLR